jgi:transglutaminase-like putative cysteine protease
MKKIFLKNTLSTFMPSLRAGGLFSLLYLLVGGLVFAQKVPMKIGDVKEDLVKMTEYPKDKDASAVVLCKYGEITYANNMHTQFDFKKRIKILKKEGMEKAIVTLYYSKDENISGLKAYCYNMVNGKVEKTKLDKSGIFEKKMDKQNTEIKFTIPNAKEGSVIEYEYEKTSAYSTYIPIWNFQEDIPVEWSEFKTAIPNMFVFQHLPQVEMPFDVKETSQKDDFAMVDGQRYDYSIISNRWALKNIPAFKREAFMASMNDYVMKIEYRMEGGYRNRVYQPYTANWAETSENLLKYEYFSDYYNKRNAIKDILENLVKDKTTTKERVSVIFDYVKNTITHNDEAGWGTDKTIKEVLEKKTGNVGAINLLLLAMLQEAKIKAYPVLVRTRNGGRVNLGTPNAGIFNYVVVYVELSAQENYILDATDPMYGIDMIDADALNGVGFLIFEPKKFDWLPLQTRKFTKSSITIMDNLTLGEDGIIKGKSIGKFLGYEGVKRRKNTIKAQKDAQAGKDKDASAETKDAEKDKENASKKFNKYTYKNLKEFDKALEGESNVEITDKAQVNGDVIYLSPMMDYAMKENPFKQEKRKFQIDYNFTKDENYYITFTIPDGYKVDELPKNLKLKSEDNSLRFDFATQQMGDNKIQLVSKFSIGRSLYEPEEYKMLKDFYAQIVAKQQEQIVLKKK